MLKIKSNIRKDRGNAGFITLGVHTPQGGGAPTQYITAEQIYAATSQDKVDGKLEKTLFARERRRQAINDPGAYLKEKDDDLLKRLSMYNKIGKEMSDAIDSYDGYMPADERSEKKSSFQIYLNSLAMDDNEKYFPEVVSLDSASENPLGRLIHGDRKKKSVKEEN